MTPTIKWQDEKLREMIQLFLSDCKSRNLAETTIGFHTEILNEFENWLWMLAPRKKDWPKMEVRELRIEQVDKTVIKAFIVDCQQRGLSAASINCRIRTLKCFFKKMVEEEEIEPAQNPMTLIHLQRVDRRLKEEITPAELEGLLKFYDGKGFTKTRNKAIIALLADSLMRVGELVTLQVEDVDFEAGTVKVFGKARKERLIGLHPKTAQALHRYWKYRKGIKSEVFFCSKFGKVIAPRQILRVIGDAGEVIGLKSLGPHRFRFSGAIRWIREGGDLNQLRLRLGHSSLAMAQYYADAAGVSHFQFDNAHLSAMNAVRVR